jgi:hypothetical protein
MVEMVPSKLDRVRDHTAPKVNREIDARIANNIRLYSTQSDEMITQRIRDLETEWDMERILEVNASTVAFIGTLLGAFVNHWFLVIPVLVTSFLFLHGTQGWCPPLPIFRRMGKRTRSEIDAEKFGMKALRGDFEGLAFRANREVQADRVIEAIARRG